MERVTKLNERQLDVIIQLYNQDLGSRKIAKIMDVNRSTIQSAYKQLKLNSAFKKTPAFALNQVEKCCKICKVIKDVSQFRKRAKNNNVSYECYCLICEKEINNNKAKLRAKRLRKESSNFVIRRSVSYFIWKTLKKYNSKKNKSCLKYLAYSIEELKVHLELLFEPWMKWENHGMYNKACWNDNDVTTWTWQIDHIIPQSDLPYSSMTDENFKKCWSLLNLRPLNSKKNNNEGVNKTRHKTV